MASSQHSSVDWLDYAKTIRYEAGDPEQMPLHESRVVELAEAYISLFEQLEASQDALQRILWMHQYREPDELPTLAFRMKEVALVALASNPAKERDDG